MKYVIIAVIAFIAVAGAVFIATYPEASEMPTGAVVCCEFVQDAEVRTCLAPKVDRCGACDEICAAEP